MQNVMHKSITIPGTIPAKAFVLKILVLIKIHSDINIFGILTTVNK